jgi:adenine/guanine phosphoribosyltransferase-like PRPP-binding protein
MEYFYYRGQKCKHCRAVIPVFGLGHHKPEEEGEDQFTKTMINFYSYGNIRERNYLLQRFINLFKERFEGDIRFDYLCVVPSHGEGSINQNMQSFAKEFSEAIGVPHSQVISRSRTVKGQHELKNKDERFENVHGSIGISEGIRGKTVLVLDNLCISGANAQEVFDALKNAGAKEAYFVCFGLGSRGKEGDFDINPNFKGKASHIVANWHWPKVSKEKREAHARNKDHL